MEVEAWHSSLSSNGAAVSVATAGFEALCYPVFDGTWDPLSWFVPFEGMADESLDVGAHSPELLLDQVKHGFPHCTHPAPFHGHIRVKLLLVSVFDDGHSPGTAQEVQFDVLPEDRIEFGSPRNPGETPPIVNGVRNDL